MLNARPGMREAHLNSDDHVSIQLKNLTDHEEIIHISQGSETHRETAVSSVYPAFNGFDTNTANVEIVYGAIDVQYYT